MKDSTTNRTLLESIQNLKTEYSLIKKESSQNSKLETVKENLVNSLHFIRKIQDIATKEKLHNAIKTAEPYQKIQQEKNKKLQEKNYQSLMINEEENIKQYRLLQDQFIENLEKSLWKNEELIELFSNLNWKRFLDFSEIIISMDSFKETYNYQTTPPKIAEEMDKISTNQKKIISHLLQIPNDLLEQSGVFEQIETTIQQRTDQVENNVSQRIYNPHTRSTAIRSRNLRKLVSKIWSAKNFENLQKIYQLLLKQRHQDGTNSSWFIWEMEECSSLFIDSNKESFGDPKTILAHPLYIITALEFLEKEEIENLGYFDLSSEVWSHLLYALVKNQEGERLLNTALKTLSNKGKLLVSKFTAQETQDYSIFLQNLLKAYSYINPSEKEQISREEINMLTTDHYQTLLKEKQEKKIRALQFSQKVRKRAIEVYNSLSESWKKEYFEKLYDKARGQYHRTGLYSHKEFDGGKISTVINEHSYSSSRWGVERQSQLDLYQNEQLLKYSTGYTTYRDRFDSEKDNYDHQYVGIIDIQQQDGTYLIQAKTWAGNIKTIQAKPRYPVEIDIKTLSELANISESDRKLFLEHLQSHQSS